MKPPVQYAMTPPRVDAPKVGKMKPVQQPKVAKMRGIDEALDYYLGGTGIPDKLRAVNSMFNPVETLGGSMRASQKMLAPETDGWGRVQAAGDMLSGVAGFVAPMVAAAKVGAPAVAGVVDAFTGLSTAPATQAAKTTATDFALRDDGSVPLFGGGKSDPTATGWTFRDMRKPVLTGADEKRVQSMFDRVQWHETELPIGRMIATQPTVNPDFAETLSSQDLLPTVVQKGNELFVRDGHHRLVKAAEAGSTKAKVALLNLDPPTDAPLLDYRAPPPWSAEDDDLLAELMAPVAPMRPVTPAQDVARLLSEGRASDVTEEMRAAADPQEMWNLYKTGATGMDMPVDHASRMARAKDMGFDEPGLHGTYADEDYSTFGRPRASLRRESYFSPANKPDFASSFAAGDEGGRVLPVMLRSGDFIDGRGGAGNEKLMEILWDNNLDTDFRLHRTDGETKRLPDWGEQNVIDAVNRSGATGLRLQERPGMTSAAVFDPTAIRSRFAMFDPRLKHLANLSAAGVGAAYLAPDERRGIKMGQ